MQTNAAPSLEDPFFSRARGMGGPRPCCHMLVHGVSPFLPPPTATTTSLNLLLFLTATCPSGSRRCAGQYFLFLHIRRGTFPPPSPPLPGGRQRPFLEFSPFRYLFSFNPPPLFLPSELAGNVFPLFSSPPWYGDERSCFSPLTVFKPIFQNPLPALFSSFVPSSASYVVKVLLFSLSFFKVDSFWK